MTYILDVNVISLNLPTLKCPWTKKDECFVFPLPTYTHTLLTKIIKYSPFSSIIMVVFRVREKMGCKNKCLYDLFFSLWRYELFKWYMSDFELKKINHLIHKLSKCVHELLKIEHFNSLLLILPHNIHLYDKFLSQHMHSIECTSISTC